MEQSIIYGSDSARREMDEYSFRVTLSWEQEGYAKYSLQTERANAGRV